jgi:uncharacterized protein (TIGR00369 family)
VTTDKSLSLSSHNNHSRCLLCGSLNPRSLRLSFRSGDDGVVRADFRVDTELQGYDGIMHGGVVAALLDAAMTHCLFHGGIQGLTGDLHVRFVHSILCDAQLEVRAWVEANRKSLYRLRAEIVCDGTIMAWAEATFMRRRIPRKAVENPT